MTTGAQKGNLVHETSTTTGTGDFTLSGITGGERRFSDVFGTGSTTEVFYYFIVHQDSNEWEVGRGHMSGTNTLVRDTVRQSSNSNNAVDFTSGTKDVIHDVDAESQVAKHVVTGISLDGGNTKDIDHDLNTNEVGYTFWETAGSETTASEVRLVRVDGDKSKCRLENPTNSTLKGDLVLWG